jgi:hypothetical protein
MPYLKGIAGAGVMHKKISIFIMELSVGDYGYRTYQKTEPVTVTAADLEERFCWRISSASVL